MEYFDRKEEVLEIQLTQEGKRLLSKGKFKPFYYEFFDDDILYETAGCGFSEKQNDSIPRIKETPRIKTQNIVYGLETELERTTDNIPKLFGITGSQQIEQLKNKTLYNKNHDPLKYALGIGDYSINQTPAWSLSLITGLLNTSSYSSTYSPESDYYEYIPQLYLTSSYVYQARNDVEQYEDLVSSPDNNIIYKSEIYDDDTYYIILEQNNINLLLKELNSTFDKENFDIEIYEVEKPEGQKENLKNLFFVKEKTNLEIVSYNDLNPISQVEVQPCDVEWFFNISYDKDAQMSVNVSNEMPEMYVDENAEDSQEPC